MEIKHIFSLLAILYLAWLIYGLIFGVTPLIKFILKENIKDNTRAILTCAGYVAISIWLIAPHVYFFAEYYLDPQVNRNWQVLSKDVWLGATAMILLIKDMAIK